MGESQDDRGWVRAGSMSGLQAAGKLVAPYQDRPVLVLWNEGSPVAMADTCIHRERSLSQGVLLNGRLVCPGHQWAFCLDDGFCKERDRFQPLHAVRVEGDDVWIGPANRPHPLLDAASVEADAG
ncbi:MAG: Rieske (2Fe-2S) protein [Actinomycetota bacterium]